MLIRLRGCPGWTAPLLFAYGIRHIFTWPGPCHCGWVKILQCPLPNLGSHSEAAMEEFLTQKFSKENKSNCDNKGSLYLYLGWPQLLWWLSIIFYGDRFDLWPFHPWFHIKSVWKLKPLEWHVLLIFTCIECVISTVSILVTGRYCSGK